MRTRRPFRLAAFAALCATTLLLASCAGTAPGTARTPARGEGARAPQPDSITIGVWHLDETGGTRVSDAGPFRLEGTAGLDTRTDFGRLRSARVFTASVESFIVVPYSPAMDTPRGITIEAWVYLDDIGVNQDTPIAARWTPMLSDQSWVFAVVGRSGAGAPEYRQGAFGVAAPGAIEFAFRTEEAGPPHAYFSTVRLQSKRWTHVAVTYDGTVVRFFIDGRPDAQFATQGHLRRSSAPLVIGNLLDPRGLSDFGGDLRAGGTINASADAAFMGRIDELRLSSAARRDIDALR